LPEIKRVRYTPLHLKEKAQGEVEVEGEVGAEVGEAGLGKVLRMTHELGHGKIRIRLPEGTITGREVTIRRWQGLAALLRKSFYISCSTDTCRGVKLKIQAKREEA
jgi:hypothetical protein